MVTSSSGGKIQPIDKAAVHRICSGQVVLDLATAVKELVENSLDAGATSVEIRLKEYGSVLIEVADNGSGVSPENYQGLTLKYHTSKISDFSDLQTLSSFGFRGEALSSLCALSEVSVTTRTKEEAVGARLTYDHSGALVSQDSVARAIGTTVAVSKLFSPLPVRYKEFNRNIRREYGRLLSILQAYALIAKGVRIVCTNQVGKSGRTTIVQTQGSSSVKDNIITVFGSKTATCLEPLNLLVSDGCKVEGFVSRPGAGCGRASGDRQFVYVNGRPVDLPKINKLLNELYGSFNSLQKPMAVFNIILAPTAYDVNVTPDKRKVFLHTEGALLVALREALESVYIPEKYTYAVNNLGDEPASTKQKGGSGGGGGLEIGHESLNRQQESDEDAPETPKGRVSAGTEEESDDFHVPKSGLSERRTSLEIRTASPSTSGQGKRAKSDFLSLLSFKLKGPKTVTSGKGIADAPGKNSTVSRNPSKILQSRLTGFVSTSKRSNATESDVFASARKDSEVEDEEELETIEPSLDSSMEVEDITALNPIHELVSCCVDPTVDTPALVASKPKLVIGLGQTEAGHLKTSGDAEKIEKDDDFMNPEDEVARLSSLSRCTADEVVGPSTLVADQPSNLPLDSTEVTFDIEKLRLKGRRGLLHFEDEVAAHGKPLKRMRGFTAATLEADGVTKGGAEKEAALVAATKELERTFNKADFKQMKVVGQFNLGFILAKLDQDLFIVDQHASDEKYNFERLSKTTVLNKQPLLRPMPVELSAAEEVIVTTHIETFRQNGFDFAENENAPPGRRLLLSAVPFSKNIMFGIGDVQELVGILANESAPVSRASPSCKDQNGSLKGGLLSAVRPSRVRGMLASRACRSSIMIGDALCQKEMEKILCHLADLDAPWNCPHGRPTMRHLADLTALRQR